LIFSAEAANATWEIDKQAITKKTRSNIMVRGNDFAAGLILFVSF